MTAILSKLRPVSGSKKRRKTLGRGDGSGHGGTSTRGHKGQKSRSGNGELKGFEGGQMPLQRRSPKWGFINPFKVRFNTVNLSDLSEKFKDGETVNAQTCLERRVIRKKTLPLKVLGKGALSKSLKVSAHAFSSSAKSAIEKAKGSCELIARHGSETKKTNSK